MPTFKAAYLVHGDDHGRIAERRARLRELAESISGAEGLELFEGDDATPDAVARALDAMTLALGRRFIIVDGVERWKDKDLDALAGRRSGRSPPRRRSPSSPARTTAPTRPERLHAVVKAGGRRHQRREQRQAVGAAQVGGGAGARSWASRSSPDAARALIRARRRAPAAAAARAREARARERRPGSGHDPRRGRDRGVDRPSAERKAWAVADALVAGDRQAAVRAYLALRAQGERVPGLLYWISQRLRTGPRDRRRARRRRASGADQTAPADALARRRQADRRRARALGGAAPPGDLRDRRPRAGLARRRRAAARARTPRRCSRSPRSPAVTSGSSGSACVVDHQHDRGDHAEDHDQRQHPQRPVGPRAQRRVQRSHGPRRGHACRSGRVERLRPAQRRVRARSASDGRRRSDRLVHPRLDPQHGLRGRTPRGRPRSGRSERSARSVRSDV